MIFASAASSRTFSGLQQAVDMIGCDLDVLQAVILVEAGSHGFDKERRPKALFEPHIFHKLLKKLKDPVPLARAERAGLAYPKWGMRPYPADSYPRIEAACQIDEGFALAATSWGLPQILGLNHGAAGYLTAKEMVEAFKTGEDEQLMAMARFIISKGLDGALKRKDWAVFAKGYNGPSYRKHAYDVKLAKAHAHFLKGSSRQEPITPGSRNAVAAKEAKTVGEAMVAGATTLVTLGGIGASSMTTGHIFADAMIGGTILISAGVLGFMAARHLSRADAFEEAMKP